MLCCLSPFLALFFGKEGLQVFSTVAQGASVFGDTIVVGVLGIHTVDNVVGERSHDHVNLGPVVEALVLLFVEFAYFLVLYALKLQ